MKIVKRLLALAVTLSLVTGLLVFASAASITVGQGQVVNVVNDETPVILQFTPTKSGYYQFYSYDSQGYDPYGYIMDADQELLIQGDDTDEGLDFSIFCYMTAGQTYYLAATCYSGSAKYTVRIDAKTTATSMAFEQDTYTGSLGDYLYPALMFYPAGSAQENVTLTSSDDLVVSIDEYGDLCLGIPGTATITAVSEGGLTATCTVTVQAPAALSLDTPWTLDAALGEQYRSFIAPADGWYGIYSQGDEIDTRVEILNATLGGILEDDEALPNHNFFAPVYLEAGELCYFYFQSYNTTGTAQVTLQKLDAATAITFPTANLSGYAGTSCWLNPVYEPQISRPEVLSRSSSDPSVAAADETGCIRFLKPGTATITFTSETGKTSGVKVTVLAAPSGSDLVAWGNCGPALQWQLNTAGVLTITGSGEMYDIYDNDSHWGSYAHLIKKAVLPEGLSNISYGAFMNCSKLTEINIPHSVRHIGNAAFSGCYSLTGITLPEQLETLGILAFEYCVALEEIHLPNSLTRLPFGAFLGCGTLTTVTLPDALISIGDEAFAGCPMEQILLPDTLKTIGYSAFAGAGLTQITLPDGLTELRDYALVNCWLEELTIPGSVKKLGCGFVAGNMLHTLYFRGNAPVFDEYAFDTLEITAYYPAGNQTWTDAVTRSYGGTVTWEPEGTPGVTLSGSVNTAMTLTLTFGEEVIQTLSAEGSYIFEALQPGSYTLTAAAVNHVTRTYTLTVTDQPLTQDVKIHLIGDIDGNGKVNIGDVAKLNGHIKNTAPLTDSYALACANVNGGSLNMGDTAALYAHIRGSKKLY